MNHKVLDGWKQLKGFCISIAWLISSMHMLTPAAGLPLHQEPPLLPLSPQSSSIPRMFPQAVKPLLTSYQCQRHLNLSTADERTLALDMVFEACCCKMSMAECLIEATLKGYVKVAAFEANKEEQLRS